MQSKLNWWFRLLGVVGMPFVLSMLAYWISMAVPGTVNRAGWEVASSIAFVGAVIPVVMLLNCSEHPLLFRAVVGFFTIAILLTSACVMQIHSTCDSTPKYIGQTDRASNDSKCGD